MENTFKMIYMYTAILFSNIIICKQLIHIYKFDILILFKDFLIKINSCITPLKEQKSGKSL